MTEKDGEILIARRSPGLPVCWLERGGQQDTGFFDTDYCLPTRTTDIPNFFMRN